MNNPTANCPLCGNAIAHLLLATLFTLFCTLALPAHAEHHADNGSNVASSSTLGESLSLQQAIDLALQNQPLLQSLDDAAVASRTAAVAESQLPDPQLKFGIINLPITSRDALNFNRDDMTMANIGVMQEMIPQAKRDAAAHKMQAEANQYLSEQAMTAQSIQRDVALAWLDVVEAQKKTALYQHIASEMANERTVAIARVSSGGESASNTLRLDSDLAMVNDKRISARRDEQKARAILGRWVGNAANRPVTQNLPLLAPNVDTAKADTDSAAIENNLQLQNAHQVELVAQSDVDRARADHAQNWSWEVMYGKRRADLSDMVSVQIAIDLPWDRPNRQDKRTAEKLVLAEKARKLTDDRRQLLSAQLQAARADWEAADAREAEHQARLIPVADARLKLAEASYSAGKQSLTEVWEARRTVLEVELDHWSILADRDRAAINIAYLVNDARILTTTRKEN